MLNDPIEGRKRDWSDLMWIESQAILKTMLDLKRNYQVPSYPVHDSLIVPKSKEDRAVAQLNAHYFGELMDYHFPATLLPLKVSTLKASSTKPIEPKPPKASGALRKKEGKGRGRIGGDQST